MNKFITSAKSLERTNPNTTLVVVDMQEDSEAANHPSTIDEVKQLIKLAISNGWGIVFLEIRNQFEDPGDTLACLLELVKDYKRWRLDVKPEKDGSDFVSAACQSLGYASERFIMCGVNLDACVVWTANGISRCYPNSTIELVHQACNSLNPAKWETYEAFVAHDNIVVVSSKA